MKIREYSEEMKLLQKQLEDTNKQIEELQNLEIEDYIVWKPEYGEKYCFFSSYAEFFEEKWGCSNVDKDRLSIGNVFRAKQEAEFQLERLKVINELKSFSSEFEYGKENYFMYYHNKYKMVLISCEEIVQRSELYFESNEKIKQAIELSLIHI